MIHDFISRRGPAYEQLGSGDFRIAVEEIGTKFDPAWEKNDVAQRVRQAVVDPFQVALQVGAQPRLIATYQVQDKKGEPPFAVGGNAEEQLHFLEVGRHVFAVISIERGKDSELRLYPPLKRGAPRLEELIDKGWNGLYGVDRGEVPVVRLSRGKGPRTDVQFGKGKLHEDQSFGWALYEALVSSLRRGHAGAGGALDANALSKDRLHGWVAGWLKEQRDVGFRALVPFLANAKGTFLPDGPPSAGVLLHAFDWNGKTVAVVQESGPRPRVRAFLRDLVGEQPSWVELRFPADAEIPSRGVSAVLQQDRLRIFGGADAAGRGLNTEWVFDLAAGGPRAYLETTFREGLGIPAESAFGSAVATDRGVVHLGGLAGFHVGRGKKAEEVPGWQRQLALQARGQAGWRGAGSLPEGMSAGGSTFPVRGGFFLGPGAGLDGRLAFVDNNDQLAIELPPLPGRYGLGQLHLDGSVLYYTGGYRDAGDNRVASATVFAIDLNQLEGWSKLGECPVLAGSNRLLHRERRPIVLGLSPKGRFTFVPGGDA